MVVYYPNKQVPCKNQREGGKSLKAANKQAAGDSREVCVRQITLARSVSTARVSVEKRVLCCCYVILGKWIII